MEDVLDLYEEVYDRKSPTVCLDEKPVVLHADMQDYAKVVRWLVDQVYPQASSIRLVQDNPNTHTPAALYETFPPAEARRILRRLEVHYTPKHGSWLNRADIEIAILERNALPHRLADEAALRRQVLAVETERDAQRRGICCQFTSRDARRKLERLYPVKEPSSVDHEPPVPTEATKS